MRSSAVARLHLDAGGSREITFEVHEEDFLFRKVGVGWCVEQGSFSILVGGDSEGALRTEFLLG